MSDSKSDNSDPKLLTHPFGNIDDKSLEAQVKEVKASPAVKKGQVRATEAEKLERIEVLHHLNLNGRDVLPGEILDVPPQLAASLVASFRAARQ